MLHILTTVARSAPAMAACMVTDTRPAAFLHG
jgi:hypothetical protein